MLCLLFICLLYSFKHEVPICQGTGVTFQVHWWVRSWGPEGGAELLVESLPPNVRKKIQDSTVTTPLVFSNVLSIRLCLWSCGGFSYVKDPEKCHIASFAKCVERYLSGQRQLHLLWSSLTKSRCLFGDFLCIFHYFHLFTPCKSVLIDLTDGHLLEKLLDIVGLSFLRSSGKALSHQALAPKRGGLCLRRLHVWHEVFCTWEFLWVAF